MTLDRLLRLFLNAVIRRLVNGGVALGTRKLRRKTRVSGGRDGSVKGPGADARAMVKRARQAAKIARRFGR